MQKPHAALYSANVKNNIQIPRKLGISKVTGQASNKMKLQENKQTQMQMKTNAKIAKP